MQSHLYLGQCLSASQLWRRPYHTSVCDKHIFIYIYFLFCKHTKTASDITRFGSVCRLLVFWGSESVKQATISQWNNAFPAGRWESIEKCDARPESGPNLCLAIFNTGEWWGIIITTYYINIFCILHISDILYKYLVNAFRPIDFALGFAYFHK